MLTRYRLYESENRRTWVNLAALRRIVDVSTILYGLSGLVFPKFLVHFSENNKAIFRSNEIG